MERGLGTVPLPLRVVQDKGFSHIRGRNILVGVETPTYSKFFFHCPICNHSNSSQISTLPLLHIVYKFSTPVVNDTLYSFYYIIFLWKQRREK